MIPRVGRSKWVYSVIVESKGSCCAHSDSTRLRDKEEFLMNGDDSSLT